MLYREIIALGGKIQAQHVASCCFVSALYLHFLNQDQTKNVFPFPRYLQQPALQVNLSSQDIPQLLKANDSKFMQIRN